MKARIKQFAGPALLLIAVIGAVVLMAREGSSLARQSVRLNLPLVLLASLLVGFGQLISALVWRQIVRAFGVRQTVRADLGIYFYSAVAVAIPGSIWVLASRSALYARNGASGISVAAATTLESFVVGIAAIAVYALTVLVQPGVSLWQRPVIGVGCAVLALVLIQPRVFNALCRWALKRTRQPEGTISADFGGRQLLQWFLVEGFVVLLAGAVLFILLNGVVAVPLRVIVPVTAAWAAAVAAGNLFFFLPGTSVLRAGALILALTPSISLPLAILYAVVSHVWSLATILASASIVWLVLKLSAGLRQSGNGPTGLPEGGEADKGWLEVSKPADAPN